MDNLRFASIAKKYSTGIFFTARSKIAYRRSPRARTPAAYFKARSRPFGNPFSRSPFMAWPNKSATALWENAPLGHFLIPQGAVPICAPGRGRGESDVQFVIKAKFDYRVDKRREKVQKNLKNLLTLRA
ncbi:hypothetical protein [Butyricicoccus pullicaecorum]|uniref:Uncharacterized protein n=1 Tax=Butyricicoccus pullicaecorum TaxID=501571 RepID=A0A1Y4LTE8_9FIRM|nr:hypothetical protein [Butyricicoccus pullicaecorum]OUP59904.1 hypothetical protein B5F15_03570 [Butyricicoccus pullicaecorum]HJF51350.1 hypothetical protein [Butyricicoccus pullicaecorum]